MPSLSFSQIVGQKAAKDLLLRAIQGDKVGHAYLFQGPEGVGKKGLALAFGSLLNCQAPINFESCGHCPSCKKFISSNHPDFVEIVPDGTTVKIDQIRELKKGLSFAPLEAKTRIVLIADIHAVMRRAEVANSLLKTLEEPPADTVFILTVDESAEILATIISRCQVVPFYALANDVVERCLLEKGLGQEEAETLALLSEGSLGRAVTLADKDILLLRRQVIEELSGLVPTDPESVPAVLDLAARCAQQKDLHEFLDLLELWIRDLMILASGQKDRLLNRDLFSIYDRFPARWNLSELYEKLQGITLAKRELLYNCNKISVLEVFFFNLVS